MDFAANHTNPSGSGEMGSLYNNGAYVTNYQGDSSGYYHHNPGISDFNDRYQLQYYSLEGLADLNQENNYIDSYLKSALIQLQTTARTPFVWTR
ncbi:MAG: hypothetical protein ACR2JE_16465 [Acidobacteriaceae bacterium]